MAILSGDAGDSQLLSHLYQELVHFCLLFNLVLILLNKPRLLVHAILMQLLLAHRVAHEFQIIVFAKKRAVPADGLQKLLTRPIQGSKGDAAPEAS